MTGETLVLDPEKEIVNNTPLETILSISKARKEEYWDRTYQEQKERNIKREKEKNRLQSQTRNEYNKAGFLYGISQAVRELMLAKEDLEKFSDAQFEELEKIAYSMVKKEIWKSCGIFLTPIIGQAMLLGMSIMLISQRFNEDHLFYGIKYWWFRKYAQNNDISLVKIIREYLLTREEGKNQHIIKMIP